MAIGFVVFSCFLVTVSEPRSSINSTVYCVKPTSDSRQCDDVDVRCKNAAKCATLDHFTQNSSQYFRSRTHFFFLEGNHSHSNGLTVNNTSNMILSGLSNYSKSVVINCTTHNVGFLFHNFASVVIEYLTITNCGQLFESEYSEPNSRKKTRCSALAFNNGADLTLDSITVSHSQMQGFYINGVEGNVLISSSTFEHAVNESAGQSEIIAGNSIFSANCTFASKAFISKSYFVNNSNMPKDSEDCTRFAAGLVIVLKCTNFAVTLDQVTFDGNKGCSGGNLALIFFNTSKPFTKYLAIQNSIFRNGYAVSGGGLFASFVEATSFGKSDLQPNCTRLSTANAEGILRITNTTFVGNVAKQFGAAISLRLKNSLKSCLDSSKVTVDNCTFRGNSHTGFGGVAIHSVNDLSFQYIKQLLPQFYLSITDSRFYENRASANYSGSGSGVVLVKDNYHVNISGVEIYNNTNCSGLLAIGSNFVFSGTTRIHHNSASSGSGMLLCSNAIMFLQPHTTLIVANNSAHHAGGGICVEQRCMISLPVCFFQLDFNATVDPALIESITVTLADNRAEYAGHQLFGGSVDYCYLIDSPFHNQTTKKSLPVYNKVFHISPDAPSYVSSPERQVCLCNGSNTNCSRSATLKPVFPGEAFPIQAVLIGQLNGTLPGTVVASLTGSHVHGHHLNTTDTVKNTNSSNCTELKYTITTSNISSPASLMLRAKFVGDMSYADRLSIYEPLVLSVPFKDCPVYFSLNKERGRCECLPNLYQIVRCEIQNNSITRIHGNWIGYNQNTSIILYSYGFGFDYCIPDDVAIDIRDPTTQCQYNRMGTLCGKCSENYSAVLGSSQCRNNCKHYHLLLIPVFALAGLILVVLLIVLNMTVTVGTINGLIFYANIVQISSTQFFHRNIVGLTPLLKVFVAWLNLDLGIPTCLYKGMDDYAKAWLQFVFPLYIWLITGVIIYLSRRFSFATVLISNNAAKVLATLVLLSYSKMLRAAIATLHMKFIHHVTLDGYHDNIHICWISDCNIPYLKGKHIPLFVAGILVALVLVPFTFVLLFIKYLNKISNRKHFTWVWKLKPFFDAYTGPFTDEARCWTGILCFVRLGLFTVSTLSSTGVTSVSVASSNFVAVSLLFLGWLFRTPIYRKKWLHTLESSFLLNLGTLCIGTLYFDRYGYECVSSILAHISVGIAFITFIGIVGYHVYVQLHAGEVCPCSELMKIRTTTKDQCDQYGTSDDSLMDDMFHSRTNTERISLLHH